MARFFDRTSSAPSKTNGLYEGNFSGTKRNGPGAFLWEDGVAFIGVFKNNIREGKGIMLSQLHGLNCYATWANDRREGLGSITNHGSNQEFVGRYLNDVPTGVWQVQNRDDTVISVNALTREATLQVSTERALSLNVLVGCFSPAGAVASRFCVDPRSVAGKVYLVTWHLLKLREGSLPAIERITGSYTRGSLNGGGCLELAKHGKVAVQLSHGVVVVREGVLLLAKVTVEDIQKEQVSDEERAQVDALL